MKWISLLHLTIPAIGSTLVLGKERVNEEVLSSVLLYLAFFIAFWLLTGLFYRRYFYKVTAVFILIAYFIQELVKANLKIAHDVFAAHTFLQPAVVAIPLEVKTDIEIMLFANIITLTPGTLSLKLSEDRKTLYVHTLYLDEGSIEIFKRNLKQGFEKKILAVTS